MPELHNASWEGDGVGVGCPGGAPRQLFGAINGCGQPQLCSTPGLDGPVTVACQHSPVTVHADAAQSQYTPTQPGTLSYLCCRGDVEECVITETPQQLAERCNADPECVAFDVHPLPGEGNWAARAGQLVWVGCTAPNSRTIQPAVFLSQPTCGLASTATGPPSPLRTGLLKHAFNESMLSMSPTDFTYVHESVAGSSSSSGGGLSSGALAGIAVGACAAAAVLAGAVWLVLRRRQQRQPCLPVSSSLHSKQVASGGGGSKPGDASIPDPPSTGTASSTLPNSLCPSGNTSTGFMDGSDSQAGSSTKEHSTGALMPGMPEGMPWVKFPRRAAWQPSAVASPFAADAGTPFVAPMSPTAASPTHGFTPTSARSQQLTASRVQPISAADAAAVVAAAALSGTITSSSNSNNNSQEPPVPELAQYVAQCEAALSQGPSQSFMQAHKQLMSVDCLPASLKVGVPVGLRAGGSERQMGWGQRAAGAAHASLVLLGFRMASSAGCWLPHRCCIHVCALMRAHT